MGLREENSFSPYAAFRRLTFSSTSPKCSHAPLCKVLLSSSSASLCPFISTYIQHHTILLVKTFQLALLHPSACSFPQRQKIMLLEALKQRRYNAKQMLIQLCSWHEVITYWCPGSPEINQEGVIQCQTVFCWLDQVVVAIAGMLRVS